jgi:hypothetical protein
LFFLPFCFSKYRIFREGAKPPSEPPIQVFIHLEYLGRGRSPLPNPHTSFHLEYLGEVGEVTFHFSQTLDSEYLGEVGIIVRLPPSDLYITFEIL